jgi:hypothetical protein
MSDVINATKCPPIRTNAVAVFALLFFHLLVRIQYYVSQASGKWVSNVYWMMIKVFEIILCMYLKTISPDVGGAYWYICMFYL